MEGELTKELDKDGCEKYLPYTENYKKIGLGIIGDYGRAEFAAHKIQVRKHSVDMHIASCVGYLTGTS